MMAPRSCPRFGGFSLIEMVVVIVVLGIGTIAMMSMLSDVAIGHAEHGDYQTGTQLLQECGEQVLAQRRRSAGYTGIVDSADCYGLTTFGGFNAPTVTVTALAAAPCPTGASCVVATISVTKGSLTPKSINLMIVDY